MRSSWITQVGLTSRDQHPYERERENTEERGRSCEDADGDEGDAATSRGCLEPPGTGRGKECPSLEPSAGGGEGAPCQHPDFGLLAARTVRSEFQLLEAPCFECSVLGVGVSPRRRALCKPVLDLPQPPVPAFGSKPPCPMAHPLRSAMEPSGALLKGFSGARAFGPVSSIHGPGRGPGGRGSRELVLMP